jgi:DNA-binding protein HU-beta
MNKSDLVEYVARTSKLTKADSERAINAMFDGITQAMRKGKDARFVGFGTFALTKRNARIGRNPRTGEPIKIAAARVAKFRSGKALRDALK